MTSEALQIPATYAVLAGADTGTFMSALIVAFAPDLQAFVLEELPNYRYVSEEIEVGRLSVPEWTRLVVDRLRHYRVRPVAWCDANTQFRVECRRYGLALLSNLVGPELRTEIAREYFQNHRIHLAPWLRILPYELERAEWPAETSYAGKFERLRRSDHTLACLEHVLSRRPRGVVDKQPKKRTLLEQYLDQQAVVSARADPHLGAR